jgi:hypothetical protein
VTLPEERGLRKQAAPDFTLYAPFWAEQIRSNTSRASAIDSKDGGGFLPDMMMTRSLSRSTGRMFNGRRTSSTAADGEQ